MPTHPEPRPDDEGLVDIVNRYGMACYDHGASGPVGSPAREDAVARRRALWKQITTALTPHPAPLGATDETWCVIFKRDTDPIVYLEGPPAEMLAYYERLAIQWTGVVLCEVLVPDASSAPMGEARARFDALRAALQAGG